MIIFAGKSGWVGGDRVKVGITGALGVPGEMIIKEEWLIYVPKEGCV